MEVNKSINYGGTEKTNERILRGNRIRQRRFSDDGFNQNFSHLRRAGIRRGKKVSVKIIQRRLGDQFSE